jgi:CheY-like chemotaxis protein
MPHILLIEDDPDTSEAMQGMLEALGHRVTCAGNGLEALKLAKSGVTPDLVLTDIVMPDMDGIETVQEFTALLSGTPIIAMSALKDTPYLRTAKLFGAKETLAKPFTLEQLKQALARAFASA